MVWVEKDPNVPVSDKKEPIEQRKTIDSTVALASNAKLIHLLEIENKRLLDLEVRYLERIKNISSELSIREDSNRKYMSLSKQYNELLLSNKLDIGEMGKRILGLQDVQKINADMEKKISQLSQSMEKTEVERDIESKNKIVREKKLEALHAENDELQMKLSLQCKDFSTKQATSQIQFDEFEKKITAAEVLQIASAEQIADLVGQLQVLKEKSADSKKKSKDYRESTKCAHLKLIENLKTHESQRIEIESSKNQLQNQCDSHVTETLALQKRLADFDLAYKHLENEFKNVHLRSSVSQKTLVDKQHQIMKQAQVELEEKHNIVQKLSRRVKELEEVDVERNNVMNDMVALVKEQKQRLHVLSLQSAAISQNSVQDKKEIARISVICRVKDDEISQLKIGFDAAAGRYSTHLIELNAKIQEDKDQSEKSKLDFAIISSASEVRILELNEKYDTFVRVKSAMLDDQNETIKTLKQTIQSKSDSHKILIQENERLNEQQNLGEDLEEMTCQVEYYEKLAKEYKVERDRVKIELNEATSKLMDRNASIEKIDKEVLGV